MAVFRLNRDRINLAVLSLREKGELQKLEKKWWYDKGQCGGDATASKVHQHPVNTRQSTNVDPMSGNVADGGPTLNQPWLNVSCLPGIYI